MCLRFQFCINQRVWVIIFYKKIRCALMYIAIETHLAENFIERSHLPLLHPLHQLILEAAVLLQQKTEFSLQCRHEK
jgi:hypothetical protein